MKHFFVFTYLDNNEHNRYERKSKRRENTGHRARKHKPESGIRKLESFVKNEQVIIFVFT